MTACEWMPEDDDGNIVGKTCGCPARWMSCKPFINTPTCDEHKCRCAKPLLVSRGAISVICMLCDVRLSRDWDADLDAAWKAAGWHEMPKTERRRSPHHVCPDCLSEIRDYGRDFRARIVFDESEGEWEMYAFRGLKDYAWLVPGGKEGSLIVVFSGEPKTDTETYRDPSKAFEAIKKWMDAKP